MEILRLAGPPGVGKTAIGWALATHCADAGIRTVFVDIDQLGMCYPATEEDPDRWSLKERALDAIAESLDHAGVQRLVVAGVAFPDDPPPRTAGGSITSVWLDAPREVIRARLAPRGWDETQTEVTVRTGAEESERVHEEWHRLKTGDSSLADMVPQVVAWWYAVRAQSEPPRAEADFLGDPRSEGRIDHASVGDRTDAIEIASPPVLWVTGPRGAGASSAGWSLAAKSWGRGVRTGFIDAAQLSFSWNLSVDPALPSTAILAREFGAIGAEELIIVASLDIGPAAVRAAFPRSAVTFIRLDVPDEQLLAQVHSRTHGSGPLLPGDDLIGATDTAADEVAATAYAQRLVPQRAGELILDVGGLDPAHTAEQIRAHVDV